MGIKSELKSITTNLNRPITDLNKLGIAEIISDLRQKEAEKATKDLPAALMPLEDALRDFDRKLAEIKANIEKSTDKTHEAEIHILLVAANQARETANQLISDYKGLTQGLNTAAQTSEIQRLKDQITPLQLELTATQSELSAKNAEILEKQSTIRELRLINEQHNAAKPKSARPVDPYIASVGRLVSLEYAIQAYPIEALVTQYTHQIKIAHRTQLLTKEDATMHLDNTFKLLSKQMTPEDYMRYANDLPGHPNKILKKISEIMLLLGAAVLAATGTVIGLGITIPSAAILIPVTAATAGLTMLAGGLGMFSARSKGLHQITNNLAYQTNKIPADQITLPLNA